MKAQHPGRSCPRCGYRSLQPVVTVDGTKQFCAGCHRCWFPEYGYLIEVNRLACSGCDDRTRCRPD